MSITEQAEKFPWTVKRVKQGPNKGQLKPVYRDVPLTGKALEAHERIQAREEQNKADRALIESLVLPASRKVMLKFDGKMVNVIPDELEPVIGWNFGKVAVAAVEPEAVKAKSATEAVTGWTLEPAETAKEPADKPKGRRA